jgi:hypothetical protein
MLGQNESAQDRISQFLKKWGTQREQTLVAPLRPLPELAPLQPLAEMTAQDRAKLDATRSTARMMLPALMADPTATLDEIKRLGNRGEIGAVTSAVVQAIHERAEAGGNAERRLLGIRKKRKPGSRHPGRAAKRQAEREQRATRNGVDATK